MTSLENILSYMTQFLEQPHPVFANLPPCPYARKERLDNKILFQETTITTDGPSAELLEDIRNFDADSKWTTMLIYASTQQVNVQECYTFARTITDTLQSMDILAIPLHPDDPFEIQGIRTRQVPCVMMLIQRRAFLSAAKEKLLNTKYYTNWTDNDYRVMNGLHQKLQPQGIFFPFMWWTDEVLEEVKQGQAFPEAVLSSTVQLLSRNDAHFWMHKWGKAYGWRAFCSFTKWRKINALNPESILLATAHGGKEEGLAVLLHPQEDETSELPSAYPALNSWTTTWPGGSYIWLYEKSTIT